MQLRKIVKVGKKVGKTFVKDYFVVVGVVTTGFIAALALEGVYDDMKDKVKAWWNRDFFSDPRDECHCGDNWDQAKDEEFEEEDLEETSTKVNENVGFDRPIGEDDQNVTDQTASDEQDSDKEEVQEGQESQAEVEEKASEKASEEA